MKNCFSGDTKMVIVDESGKYRQAIELENLYEKKVLTICSDLVVRYATVEYFGEQELFEISFAPSGSWLSFDTKSYKATRNHRWILTNGLVTHNIKVGNEVFLIDENMKRVPYICTKVEELNITRGVFCAKEPVTQSFMIEGGIITGNCSN